MKIGFEAYSGSGRSPVAIVALAMLALLVAGYAQTCRAGQPGQATFPSAEDASRAENESDEQVGQDPPEARSNPDVRLVVERGIHDVAGEVRNSLDFHRSQDGGGEVTRVVLSGSALDLPGFADALQSQLRVDVAAQTVTLADQDLAGKVSTHRLAIAAGLATTEIHQ